MRRREKDVAVDVSSLLRAAIVNLRSAVFSGSSVYERGLPTQLNSGR